MNAEPAAPVPSPAPPPQAAAQSAKPRRKWTGPAPAKSNFIWILLLVTVVLGTGIIVLIHYVYQPRPQAPVLAVEFHDYSNYFAIQPPRTWMVDDRAIPGTVVIQGPREPRFRPLMQISSQPAP